MCSHNATDKNNQVQLAKATRGDSLRFAVAAKIVIAVESHRPRNNTIIQSHGISRTTKHPRFSSSISQSVYSVGAHKQINIYAKYSLQVYSIPPISIALIPNQIWPLLYKNSLLTGIDFWLTHVVHCFMGIFQGHLEQLPVYNFFSRYSDNLLPHITRIHTNMTVFLLITI